MKKFYLSVFAFFMLCCSVGAQQVIFDDNYASGVTFVGFGGSTNNVSVDNTVAHTGTSSLKVVIPASGYTGGALVAAAPIDVSAYNAVTFWAKANGAVSFDKAGFGNNTSDANYAVELAPLALTTSWQKFIIPIPDASKLTTLAGLWHMATGTFNGSTVWFDNIQYENIGGGVIGTPTASMATATITQTLGSTFTVSGIAISIPVNGTPEALSAIAPVYYNYSSSVSGIVTFDALGNITAAKAGQTIVTAKLGTTNVSGSLTVNVTGLVAPTTAAPTPTIPAGSVTALFNSSNVYVNNPIDNEGWLAPWAGAKLTYPYVIAGTKDTILQFYNITFTGSEFTQHEIDATTNKFFHIDVWTPNVQSLSVKLVDFAPSGSYNAGTNLADLMTFTLKPGVWNSLVINLDSLKGLQGHYNYMAQLLLVDNDPGAGGTVFADNIYFASTAGGTPAPNAPLTAAPTPTIPAANVTALFNSSNVYVNSPIDSEGWLAPWAGAKLTYPYVIAGTKDTILEFSNITFTGSEFTQHEIDATSKKYFHIDVWTPDVQSLSVKLVDFAPTGAYDAANNLADLKTFTVADGTLKPNAWNSLVINMDSLAGLNKHYNYMAQLLLVDNDATPGGTVFVDNVYFSNQGALPVRFIDFNGHLENNQAVLNWSTTNEINNKGYNVERSQDGVKFDAVSFVAGKGRGTQVNNYTYSDPKLLSGANYYRLKQVDLDGNFAYSSAIKIDYSKFAWSVLGNGTANSWIQLQLDHKANISLKVYSLQGQLIKVINKGTTPAGTYTVPLSLGASSHGVYIVKLQVDDKQYSNKVLN